MPAVSQAQQRLMAMAEHDPQAVRKENRGVLDMSHTQLHDYAATPRRGLPIRSEPSMARRALLSGMRG